LETQSTNTIRGLNADNLFIVPSSGLSGGLWLIWNNVHNLQITLSSPNFIVAEVQLAVGLPMWNLVCVYGELISYKRQAFWESFTSKISILTLIVSVTAISSHVEKFEDDFVNRNKTVF